MKQFLLYLIQTLVDKPESVTIREIAGEKQIIFEIICDRNDMGKVIGKSGQTINAIRVLLHAVASRNKLRVNLSLIE